MSPEDDESEHLPPEPLITVKRADVAAVHALFRAHGAALKAEAYKLKELGAEAGAAMAVGAGLPHMAMLRLYSDLEAAARPSPTSHSIALASLSQTLNVISGLTVFYGGPVPAEMAAGDAGRIKDAREKLPEDPVGDRRSMEQLANIREALEALAGTLGVKILRPAGGAPGEGTGL